MSKEKGTYCKYILSYPLSSQSSDWQNQVQMVSDYGLPLLAEEYQQPCAPITDNISTFLAIPICTTALFAFPLPPKGARD